MIYIGRIFMIHILMDMIYDIFLMFNPGRMIPHETEEEHFDFAAATGH